MACGAEHVDPANATVADISAPTSTVTAGWYPDPAKADGQRYWDGERWTVHNATDSPAPGSTSRVLPVPPGGRYPGVYTPQPSQAPAVPAAGQTGNVAGVMALVLSLIAILLAVMGVIVGLFSILGLLFGGAAIILGAIGRKSSTARFVATTGLVIGVIAVLLSLLGLAVLFILIGSY